MLKTYRYNGGTFQFIEGEQPAGAVEVTAEPPRKAATTENKAVKPANKARAVKAK